MGPVQSVKLTFEQYASCQGRTSRSEYWWSMLFCAVVTAAVVLPLGLLGSWLGETSQDGLLAGRDALGKLLVFLAIAVYLLMAPMLICTKVRRLHDLGMSGWWFWAFQLPMADLAWLVVCLFPSQPEGDRYGPGSAAPPASAPTVASTAAPAPL